MLGDGYWLPAVGRYSAQRGHNNAAGRKPACRPPQGGRKDACNGNRSRGSGNPVRFLNGQVVLSLVEKLPSARSIATCSGVKNPRKEVLCNPAATHHDQFRGTLLQHGFRFGHFRISQRNTLLIGFVEFLHCIVQSIHVSRNRAVAKFFDVFLQSVDGILD